MRHHELPKGAGKQVGLGCLQALLFNIGLYLLIDYLGWLEPLHHLLAYLIMYSFAGIVALFGIGMLYEWVKGFLRYRWYTHFAVILASTAGVLLCIPFVTPFSFKRLSMAIFSLFAPLALVAFALIMESDNRRMNQWIAHLKTQREKNDFDVVIHSKDEAHQDKANAHPNPIE